MMMVKTELKPSSIEGLGVFALEFIPSGSVVWKLDDRFYSMVHENDLKKLPPLMQDHFERYSWPHLFKEGILCCCIDNGRFMNHSKNANTDFRDQEVGKAKKDILVGEEITCNYAEFDPHFKGF